MRRLVAFAAFVFAFLTAFAAEAAIVVRVDKTTQTMRVMVDGEHLYTWAVSTGRAGYNTPNGSYRPQRLERHWRSRKYGMAPMPHSIFFRGGYAIHGTTMVGRLGRTDSHGCIRLAPGHARTLFEMVARRRGATRIVIEGTSRPAAPVMVARRSPSRVAAAPARTAQMRLAQPARAGPAAGGIRSGSMVRAAVALSGEARSARAGAVRAGGAGRSARAGLVQPGKVRSGSALRAAVAAPGEGRAGTVRAAAAPQGEAALARPAQRRAAPGGAFASRPLAVQPAAAAAAPRNHFLEWFMAR